MNEVIINLIELLKNDLVEVYKYKNGDRLPGDKYNSEYSEMIMIKTKGSYLHTESFEVRLAYYFPFGYKMWDNLTNRVNYIKRKEYLSIEEAVEKQSDNKLILRMKKILENNHNKVLEEGRKLTQDVST